MNTENTMHEAIKTFILNRKIKKEEMLLTTKLAKDKDGGLNRILIKIIKSSGKCPDENLKEVVDKKKPKEETSLEFQFQKYCDLIILAKTQLIDVAEYIEIYKKQKQKTLSEHQYSVWLDDNCHYAEYASVATHVSKLTHSSNKATCFFDEIPQKNTENLTTSSLHAPIVDGAYDNAKYSPVVSLLLVEDGERFFYENIIKGSFEGLDGFTKNVTQLDNWKEQLKKSIVKPAKATHTLSKQVYFPIKKQPTENKDWNLLSILVSSSLAHEIFRKTGAKYFNDKNLTLKEKYQSKSLYCPENIINFPNKVTLMVTQSSHQNTSILNGKRSGRLFLLSSKPPTWQNQLKPPINSKSWFDHGVPFRAVQEDLEYLRSFFLRFEELNLSTKDPKRREWLIKWGNQILSNVLFYAEAIQNLAAGWSSTPAIKLKPEHQYFLDPYRTDITFQNAKSASDWQNIVASDFAQWLNRKIQGKDKKFTPQAEHTKLWKVLMLTQLREHNQMVKVVLATTKEELA
jgi:CRISPR-associated protein Csy1